MGVIKHCRSAPIHMSEKYTAHVSEKSLSNISPNPQMEKAKLQNKKIVHKGKI
jgi:hypothetical protein